MATTNGTSVLGEQNIGTFGTSMANWYLGFTGSSLPAKTERVGTLLLYKTISATIEPVQFAAKLYGAGIFWPLNGSDDVTGLKVKVIWFRAGLGWTWVRP